MNYELGFLGAGNMAEAIARAAIEQNIVDAGRIIASDPESPRRDVFAGLGIAVTDDNAEVIAQSGHVMLAVKPQTVPKIAEQLAALDAQRQIVISIMAGIGTTKIEQAIGGPARVVRVMPNTPLMVGGGMAGIALGEHAKAGDEALAMKLFGAAGRAVMVGEADIDAITAVSGSGPAYVFYLAEAMVAAATDLGLGSHAAELVEQTVLGAAQLLAGSDDPPAELRRKVTSPGGTTEAAIKHLEGNKTREVIVNAIKAAQARSIELGK